MFVNARDLQCPTLKDLVWYDITISHLPKMKTKMKVWKTSDAARFFLPKWALPHRSFTIKTGPVVSALLTKSAFCTERKSPGH